MHTRSMLLGVVTVFALVSAPLRHAAAQATPSNGPAAYTYVPEAIQDQLAEVMRAEAPLHQVTTITAEHGTTVVLETPLESLSEEFVHTSEDTTARTAPKAALALIQVNPDGSIDIVSPQGDLHQIK